MLVPLDHPHMQPRFSFINIECLQGFLAIFYKACTTTSFLDAKKSKFIKDPSRINVNPIFNMKKPLSILQYRNHQNKYNSRTKRIPLSKPSTCNKLISPQSLISGTIVSTKNTPPLKVWKVISHLYEVKNRIENVFDALYDVPTCL